MAIGKSLHIGLNSVDPAQYAGWSGPLVACENDAATMMAIATAQGFDARQLLTANATREAVLDAIAEAAGQLEAGDLFLLTISSHGGQLADGNDDEVDGQDETWCLYDGELLDDEVYHVLSAFVAGTRILVASDSCHSGTVVEYELIIGAPDKRQAEWPASRLMPPEIAVQVREQNKAFYHELAARPELRDARARVVAPVLLLSGCRDDQESMDGQQNGAFTGALKAVWNDGQFASGYDDFVAAIVTAVNNRHQTPGLLAIGPIDEAFRAQKPFTI